MSAFDITIGKFNNSMNFIFGVDGGEDFDVLNNPYIEYLGFDMHSGDGIELAREYEFELCAEEHLANFMQPHVYGWYP